MEENVEYYILMGNIFIKRIVEFDSFYLLNQNGEWIDYPSLVDMFYDPSVDQQRISFEDIDTEIEKIKSGNKMGL